MKKSIITILMVALLAPGVFAHNGDNLSLEKHVEDDLETKETQNVRPSNLIDNLRDASTDLRDRLRLNREEAQERLLDNVESEDRDSTNVLEVRSELQDRTDEIRADFRTKVKNAVEENRLRVLEERRVEAEKARRVFSEESRDRVRALQNVSSNERVEAIKEFAEKRKEEIRDFVEQRRKDREDIREQAKKRIENQRELIKERLEQVQDERRRELALKINEQLAHINERFTEHYLDVLAQLETVLANITTRTDRAEARGADVAVVREAISAASGAIEEAIVAVEAQAAVEYDLSVTEDTLKEDMKVLRDTLRENLESVRNKVRSAHDAVRSVAVSLAQTALIDETEAEEAEVEGDENQEDGAGAQNQQE